MKRILQHFIPGIARPDPGRRNTKGEWRPDYPCAYAPVFVWPPRPLAFLKWLVTWPGFMWPRNLVLLAISAASWFWFQPELSRCAQFQWEWISQLFLRNQVLIWLVYGSYHLYFYILKGEGTKGKYDPRWPARNSRTFLFRDQVYDNIFWTAGVGCALMTAYEVVTMWLYANGKLPYVSWSTHPVWFVVWMFLIPFWREFHFYWIHRLIHWKPLYQRVHYLHHKNINPISWSGMAMHPVETFLYFSVVLIHWVVPSHPLHFIFNLQHTGLSPACGHHGFEGPILDDKWPTGSYFHYLHHRYFECNYGEAGIPLDKWFGTFRDGTPDGEGSKLREKH
ncbi:MAG: sterol desaturase family protein [Verrucomicrobia bacterium]|jgi:sterol desaturase/sphingolipid hydroxylase (fatty acid hydroxylase superfamily)|nr:sterol desaturase family protein [Verrucomicrobiota bacterium]